MRFGVNYIPSTDWLYSWTEWRPDAVEEDLAAVRGLGFDHVRLHLLWPLFQPNPTLISRAMLDRLVDLLDICDRHGLQAEVTALNGWMSGFVFRPSWMSPGLSFFTDSGVLTAQTAFLRAVAGAVAGHPAALGIDIGNELSVLGQFEPAPVAPASADGWARRLLATCQEVMPHGMHCNGVDHTPWLTDRSPFSRTALASDGGVTVVHAWPSFTGAFERYGNQDGRALHIGEYLAELAGAHAADPDRQVWVQELGLSQQWIPGDRIADAGADFLHATSSASRLWGVTWWCSHDIDPALSGFAPLEHDLGLLTIGNAVKPIGERVAEAIAEARDRTPPHRDTAVVLPDEGGDLGAMDAFLRLKADGVHPAVVLKSAADDPEHLRRRGIHTLVDPA